MTDVGAHMNSLLSLAEKYQVEGVKPFVLHLLERDWPPTLAEWLRGESELSRLTELWTAGCADLSAACPDDLYPIDPATAVDIGLAYSMPSILPAAFYALSSINLQDDWYRWNTNEKWNYVESEDSRATDPKKYWRRTARWSWLDKDQLMKVLLGKQALQARQAVLGRVYRVVNPADTGKAKQRCVDELSRLETEYTVGSAANPHKPLQVLVKMLMTLKYNRTLCKGCRDLVRANINKEMEKLWTDLPQMFSLDQAGEGTYADITSPGLR